MQFLTNVFVTHQRFAVTVHWKRSERKPKLLNTMGCYCFAVVLFLLVVFVVLFTLDCNFVWEFCQIILSEPYVEISSEQLSMAFPHSTSSLTFPQWFLKRSSNLSECWWPFVVRLFKRDNSLSVFLSLFQTIDGENEVLEILLALLTRRSTGLNKVTIKPLVLTALPASLSARLFSLIPVSPGNYIYGNLLRSLLNIASLCFSFHFSIFLASLRYQWECEASLRHQWEWLYYDRDRTVTSGYSFSGYHAAASWSISIVKLDVWPYGCMALST